MVYFENLISKCLLYSKAIDFCILTLYLLTLINSVISSGSWFLNIIFFGVLIRPSFNLPFLLTTPVCFPFLSLDVTLGIISFTLSSCSL